MKHLTVIEPNSVSWAGENRQCGMPKTVFCLPEERRKEVEAGTSPIFLSLLSVFVIDFDSVLCFPDS
jgi:hypothetical protein